LWAHAKPTIHMELKKYNSILLLLLGIVFLLISVFPFAAYAVHPDNTRAQVKNITSGYVSDYSKIPGEQICDDGDDQHKVVNFDGGLYVPVKDFEAEAFLREVEDNTLALRYYLRQLCYKEFSLDHTIQQKWMEVMGKFVLRTVKWINTAYSGNPIYVSNPHVYYRNVDYGVATALIKEIECLIDPKKYPSAEVPYFKCPNSAAQIDAESGRIVIRSIEGTMVERLFGDLVEDWTVTAPQEKEIYEDRDRHTTEAFLFGTIIKPNNITNLLGLATNELEQRQKVAREVEEQKLQWGRGFFPWEICGQQVFTKNPEDIRTCRTLTPGALIQDLSSLVIGSAVRQIENADEYEEWISGNAFMVLHWALNNAGIGNKTTSSDLGADSPDTISRNIDAFEIVSNDRYEAILLQGLQAKDKSLFYYNDEPLPRP